MPAGTSRVAHYNPAVTLGVFLRGKLPLAEVGPYWAAQLVAAFLAAWLAKFTVHPGFVHTLSTSGAHAILSALFAEFFFTFALVYVVLNVATSKDQPGNQFFGLAIGSPSPRERSRSAGSAVPRSTRP